MTFQRARLQVTGSDRDTAPGDQMAFTAKASCVSRHIDRAGRTVHAYEVLALESVVKFPKHSCEYLWCETTSRHPDDGHSCEIGYVPASLSASATVDYNGATCPTVGVGVRCERERPSIYMHLAHMVDNHDLDVDVQLTVDEIQRLIDNLTKAAEIARSIT